MTFLLSRVLIASAICLPVIVGLTAAFAQGRPVAAVPSVRGDLQLTIKEQDNPGIFCLPFPEMLAWLKNTYKEEPVGSGVAESGSQAVLTLSDKGGWTLILRSPKGPGCVLMGGTGFGLSRPPMPGESL